MNRHSDNDKMNAALEEDAAKLEALGQSGGITFQELDDKGPCGGRFALADLIRTRLMGVLPDDQDITLEDIDWALVIAALEGEAIS